MLTLLTVAVAAAIGSITIVHNTAPADNSEFGSANILLKFDGSDPRKLEAGLAAAEESFGTIDVIAHRSVAVPGGVETVDFRAQDPDGAYGRALLALRRGSYPTGPGQVAVTDGVAELLRLELGSTLALDGRRRTVVGIVENPRKLSDEFALVSPSSAGAADYVTVLVDASDESIESFFGPGDRLPTGLRGRPDRSGTTTRRRPRWPCSPWPPSSCSWPRWSPPPASRSSRSDGSGSSACSPPSAPPRSSLRLVLLANGALVGAIAAVVGTTAGLAAWVVFAPTLESAVDHRIDRLSLPWWLIATTVVLAVLGATAPPGGRGERPPASRSCSRSRGGRRGRGPRATPRSRPRC